MNGHPNRMENYVVHAASITFLLCAFQYHCLLLLHLPQRTIYLSTCMVYGVKKVIYPLRVTQEVVPGRHVDLLLHECGGIQHYSAIRNFSRLISGQI